MNFYVWGFLSTVILKQFWICLQWDNTRVTMAYLCCFFFKGCYYVQITLLKVRFNLFFDLSHSILVNYLERIIQMSGRKLSSQMNIVCTADIITIAWSGSNWQVYIILWLNIYLCFLHFLTNFTSLIELVFVKKFNLKMKTYIKLVNNLVCCPYLTRQNQGRGISALISILCPLCFGSTAVRT